MIRKVVSKGQDGKKPAFYGAHPVYCDQCGTRVGYRNGKGELVLFGRHHGEQHQTVLSPGLDKKRKGV